MADIFRTDKPLAVSPIKTGQPLGAILASLGIEHSIPLVHGAQGCSAFAKVFFIQHFHDPVPLQSTAMDPTSTIMGADGNIFTALDTLCQRNNPQAIVLLSTGLSEAQGSDISRVVRQFREEYPRHKGVAILTVNTPDFYGSMENGFSAVLESVIEQWVPPAPRPAQRNRRVNLLISHLCSPGDIEWLRRCVEAFGLQPVILPDLAQSMDGHLAQGDFSPLTQGGTPLRQIEQMGQSLCSFAIGVSLHRASSLLAPRCRGEVIALPHLMTLESCDAFIHQLAKISGRAVPEWLERQRGQLQDAMIDCHMWLQGQRMAIAAEGICWRRGVISPTARGCSPARWWPLPVIPACASCRWNGWCRGTWRICKPCCARIPPTCWWRTRTPATWRSSLRCRWCARVFRSLISSANSAGYDRGIAGCAIRCLSWQT